MDATSGKTRTLERTGAAPRSRTQRNGNAGVAARHRAMLYAILAQGLSTPTESLCQALEDGAFWATLRYAIGRAPPLHRRQLDSCLAAPPANTTLDALLVEYTRLFGTNLICAHYEADYLAGGSFRLAHVLAEVTALYTAFGVRISDLAHERPDHIAIELDFMNFLASKEAHAAQRGRSVEAKLCRRAQRHFFQRHVGRWARAFACELEAATHAEFYRSLRQLLEALILSEAEYFRTRLGEIEVKRGTNAQNIDASPVCDHCNGTRTV